MFAYDGAANGDEFQLKTVESWVKEHMGKILRDWGKTAKWRESPRLLGSGSIFAE